MPAWGGSDVTASNHTDSSPPRADVVVVGGGAVGLAVAWRAAGRGLEVVVCEASMAGSATPAAAGLLAPVTEVHFGEEELLRLNLESAGLFPAFVRELEETSGLDPGYRTTGTIVVARDSDDNALLEELFRYQARLGLDVTRLKSPDCRRLEPALVPSVRGGILVEGDHQVDPRLLLEALREACRRAGVRFMNEAVVEVSITQGRAEGVVLSRGRRVAAKSVVIAAGCRSGSLRGVPEGALPVRPVKGQLLHLESANGTAPIERNVRGVDVYLLARAGGRVVVGATVEEQGFDTSVTAGAVYQLLRDAYELVPGITELELAETAVGLRPGSPDNAPLLGETEVEGLIAATGHYRNGILLTPITGAAIAELLATGSVLDEIAPFSPLRFRRQRAEKAEVGA
jgi:glycine oxidase